MKFHHLVHVNDPLQPLLDALTPEQVWRGLALRAEDPLSFVLGLDACRILERAPDGLRRELRFGQLLVRDRVRFEPPLCVRYDTEAQDGMAAATLIMSIEASSPELLSVRFDYDIHDDDSHGDRPGSIDAFYNEFRRSAYVEADIDTIGRIRQLAAEGKL